MNIACLEKAMNNLSRLLIRTFSQDVVKFLKLQGILVMYHKMT